MKSERHTGAPRWSTTRRYRRSEATLALLEELNVIADYRRAEESRLLRGDRGA